MKRHLIVIAIILAAGVSLAVPAAGGDMRELPELTPLPEGSWGVYSWCSWNPRHITREKCPDIVGAPIILHWRSLEPADGDYRFDEALGERLRLAKENRFRVFTMIWVGPSCPKWIYDKGVPRVTTDREGWTFPYYFDEDYVRYFRRLVRKLGEYVNGLPADLRELIIFVQVCEGSTGDGYCYKGRPKDAKYNISRDEWGRFRLRTWDLFKEVFQDAPRKVGRPPLRLLVNGDANREPQLDWLMRNQREIGCKQGMFSHGYHISYARTRLAKWRDLVARAEAAGKTVFTRGEMDAEWQRNGWSRKNLGQSLYWSALYATHCGLDLWNVPGDACQGDAYAPAIRFFNKYAGRREAATSPAAFCALRRGLDASDTRAFPEEVYGKAHRRNVDRCVKIARAFARYGAVQGDPPAALRGSMGSRQRKDYNDVGWEILPGNYFRFLEQLAPDETSAGLWHVGPEKNICGRFARGFERRSGKTAMRFRLDDGFFPSDTDRSGRRRPRSVRLRVVYLDRGTGEWRLSYSGGRGKSVAFKVRCADSGRWLSKVATVTDARFERGLAGGADLALEHLGGDDVVFHMMELDRAGGR